MLIHLLVVNDICFSLLKIKAIVVYSPPSNIFSHVCLQEFSNVQVLELFAPLACYTDPVSSIF